MSEEMAKDEELLKIKPSLLYDDKIYAYHIVHRRTMDKETVPTCVIIVH